MLPPLSHPSPFFLACVSHSSTYLSDLFCVPFPTILHRSWLITVPMTRLHTDLFIAYASLSSLCVPSYYTRIPRPSILVTVLKDTCKNHSRFRLGLLCNPRTIRACSVHFHARNFPTSSRSCPPGREWERFLGFRECLFSRTPK